jgi:uncharacterized integral membrane protein
MNLKLFTGLITIALVIVFSIQNVSQVTLKFFAWEWDGSLSLFLILAVMLGAVIGSLFTMVLRRNKKLKDKIGKEAPDTKENKVKAN